MSAAPSKWRFATMEWNLIKEYLMDWKVKRFFAKGDTFVECFVQPTSWQLLQLFGDGSQVPLDDYDAAGDILDRASKYFNKPLTVGTLVDMSRDSHVTHVMEQYRASDPDLKAWSHLLSLAYETNPVDVETTGRRKWTGGPVVRQAPTDPYTEVDTGKVCGTPAWERGGHGPEIFNSSSPDHSVCVTRTVPECHLSGDKVVDQDGYGLELTHILRFHPQRQEYGGHGNLHTGKFDVESLGHNKIHNTYFDKPGTVSNKKLQETFGDQGDKWDKRMTGSSHPQVIDPSCVKPWTEDMVTTVEKVDYDFKIMRLKIQKFKYLWDVEVSTDEDGNSTVQAVEMPDPSTKYPNGLVMTRTIDVPIIKTDLCWRVHPEPFATKQREVYWHRHGGVQKETQYVGWGFKNNTHRDHGYNWSRPKEMELHYAEQLLANNAIRKKGSKRPATHFQP